MSNYELVPEKVPIIHGTSIICGKNGKDRLSGRLACSWVRVRVRVISNLIKRK